MRHHPLVRYSFILLLATVAMTLYAQEEKIYNLTKGDVPQNFPLKLVQGTEYQGADFVLMDWETRKLRFAIKNMSDQPLKLRSIFPGCPCLKLEKPVEGLELKPQETYAFNVNLLASELVPGDFNRAMYVELTEQELAMITVSGKVVPKMEYTPAVAIDLGQCHGIAPWKRTFKIKSLFPEGKLKLLPPAEDKLFKYELTQVNQQEFQLEVTPRKLPLPVGRQVRKIKLGTTGIPNYGPVQLSINIRVNKPLFHLEEPKIRINQEDIDHQKPYVVSSPIQYGKKGKKSSSPRHRHPLGNSRIAYLPAAADEQAFYPLDSKKTWEYVAKGMTLKAQNPYPGVTVQLVPQHDRLDIQTTFPANFFKKSPHGMIYCRVMYQRIPLQNFTLSW